eukprot:3666162-Amphidinium_carterae.2
MCTGDLFEVPCYFGLVWSLVLIMCMLLMCGLMVAMCCLVPAAFAVHVPGKRELIWRHCGSGASARFPSSVLGVSCLWFADQLRPPLVVFARSPALLAAAAH